MSAPKNGPRPTTENNPYPRLLENVERLHDELRTEHGYATGAVFVLLVEAHLTKYVPLADVAEALEKLDEGQWRPVANLLHSRGFPVRERLYGPEAEVSEAPATMEPRRRP